MTKESTQLEIIDPEKSGVKGEKPSPDKAEDVKGLRDVATEALEAANKALDAYFRLCVYIRDKQLAPATVEKELKALGYGKVRISEIKRVSFCADKVFEQYRKRVIGFRLALNEARKPAKKVEQVTSEEVLFGEALARLVQEFVPLKGKIPFWLKKFELEAQGAAVTFTAIRKTNIKHTENDKE